jgi:hypothetical protein
MAKLSRKIRHPSRFLDDAPASVRRPVRRMAERPYASGAGLLLLLLGVVGFIAIFPELHREAHIMRM